MAETVKINDIASQLSTASRLVVSTDFFWVYAYDKTLGEQYVKIPAEFVRAYLTNGITPTIDENGNWIIGGKETGVKAEGVTPMLRSNRTLGIEVSYDKGKTWQMFVLYSDLAPDIQPLVDAYNTIVQSEQGRVNAESARVKAETDRVNEFALLKSASEEATTSANSAASAANSAAEAAEAATATANENEQTRQTAEAERVKAETARAKEEAARAKAETSRANAESARVQAETDRQSAWAAWFENTTSGVKALWNTWHSATKKAWSDWFGATESAGVRKTWTDWFTSIENDWTFFNMTASQAESARENAENIRGEQEAARVSAEQTRVSEFATIKSDAAEATSAASSAAASANAAATNANDKAAIANTAAANSDKQTALCKSATDLAEELNAHPQMQGENGNWWKWNTETDQYEDTGIIARGGAMYPRFRQRRNHVLMYDDASGFKNRVSRRRNHAVIKF